MQGWLFCVKINLSTLWTHRDIVSFRWGRYKICLCRWYTLLSLKGLIITVVNLIRKSSVIHDTRSSMETTEEHLNEELFRHRGSFAYAPDFVYVRLSFESSLRFWQTFSRVLKRVDLDETPRLIRKHAVCIYMYATLDTFICCLYIRNDRDWFIYYFIHSMLIFTFVTVKNLITSNN